MDLAQEVGYLRGMQEATQRELQRLATAQEATSSRVDELASTAATKSDIESVRMAIDEAVTKLQGGSGTQPAQSTASTILRNPMTPVFAAFVILAVMFIATLSVLSNRDANSLVPTGISKESPKETKP